MRGAHKLRTARRFAYRIGVSGFALLVGTSGCADNPRRVADSPATLRVGVGGLAQQTPQAGLRPLVGNLSIEGLVNLNEDGRPRPWLAEGWTTSADGLLLTIHLRDGARFHDGSPVSPPDVVAALRSTLPRAMGPAFQDVVAIEPSGDRNVRITLKAPSPFVLDALESPIERSGGIGTGPYVATPQGAMQAFGAYYLGKPTLDKLTVTSYPSVRAAWAELLRGNLDMLYEVNIDALESLQAARNISVFSFVRRYQYLIILGTRFKAFESAEIRRELNAALTRESLVGQALNSYGVPSTGPIWPQHWALSPSSPRLGFDRELARKLMARRLRFTCLVPPDTTYERLALHVKQQLAGVGVDMNVEEASEDSIVAAMRSGDFDAALVDGISGPSLFRLYQRWHTGGPFNLRTAFDGRVIDAALDEIRHAHSDDEYRTGVARLQQAFVDDPPAIFLAWAERARAVSRRFDVPAPEKGRDVLATLRLWRPASQIASRN
jgi:peptide/nickel transport system substrate-binding protein